METSVLNCILCDVLLNESVGFICCVVVVVVCGEGKRKEGSMQGGWPCLKWFSAPQPLIVETLVCHNGLVGWARSKGMDGCQDALVFDRSSVGPSDGGDYAG